MTNSLYVGQKIGGINKIETALKKYEQEREI
jgi:hypothetical protein